MAQKKKTRAEKVESSVKSKRYKMNKSGNKGNSGKKNPSEDTVVIPVRVYTSIAFLGAFLLFLIMFFHPEGSLTFWLYEFLHGLIGPVAFGITIPCFLYLFFIHAFSGDRPVKMRTICLLVFVLSAGCMFHLTLPEQVYAPNDNVIKELFLGGIGGTTGGLICGGIASVLKWLCGSIISFILLLIAALLTLLGGMQITIPSIVRAVQERPRDETEEDDIPKQEPAAVVVNHIMNKRSEQKKLRKERLEERRRLEEEAQARAEEVPVQEVKLSRAEEIMNQIDSDVDTPVAVAAKPKSRNSSRKAAFEESFPESMPDYEPEPDTEEPVKYDPEELHKAIEENKPEKVSSKQAVEAAAEIALEIAQSNQSEKPVYYFPPIDLLKHANQSGLDATAEMRDNTRRLNETLASFKIEAHIINVTRGPSVTRYEVELEKGVRLNKLTSVADDIALSLGAASVRIAAIPGKISVVGIEVPNKAVTTVSLREVIDSQEFHKAKSLSSFAVGKDIGDNCIVGNIARLPHMLIAGTTGSGKSVCMNSIIISLLYKASPDDVKLIMVDPKMVELGIYNGIPHLLIPVVTDPKKAAGSLQWAVAEMMRRYKSMSDAGVRDLDSYNSIMESQDEDGKKLPQVVVIIDELADLMLVAAKEVEESICRIAQMGRAAGIHLIIATQRPSADVITGLMKANIPSRIAFAVASAMESRIILDTQGAEKLVGRGDMLYAPIGNGKPKRVQGCFVSDGEVEAVANYVKSKFTSEYDQNIMDEIEKKAAQTGNKPSAATAFDPEPNSDELDGDEMLPAAVDVILETKQASVSMLQRRLKLGYARAARIVDEMEEKGIVGPFQGSKPREILITKEQWEDMKSGKSSQMNFEDLEESEELEDSYDSEEF